MGALRRLMVLFGLVLIVCTTVTGTSSAAPPWAAVATATIHPGVQTVTVDGQCTANFVFIDANEVYIGQAAHCATTGGPTETNGCRAGLHPLGTPVTIGGASRPGVMVYNSWITMQSLGEADPKTCQFNDLALVRIHRDDRAKVNPSIPHWGGPVGISTGTAVGELVYSFGNSSLRLGLTQLSPKQGVSLGDRGGGWSHTVYTVTPGVPGDSGSAFLDARGRAVGVLSTVGLLLLPASNGLSNLALALDYMRANGGPQASLALGTEPFTPNKLPLGL